MYIFKQLLCFCLYFLFVLPVASTLTSDTAENLLDFNILCSYRPFFLSNNHVDFRFIFGHTVRIVGVGKSFGDLSTPAAVPLLVQHNTIIPFTMNGATITRYSPGQGVAGLVGAPRLALCHVITGNYRGQDKTKTNKFKDMEFS